ncbi:hypothetical protein ACO0R3_002503 [Hanseniaspora guilliermondii]
MSKVFKLFTFHGQGSIFDIANISFKDITISQLYKNRFKDYCLAKQCYEPQVISLLSNLKYQDLLLQPDVTNKKAISDSAILGHSLGELQFLSCNKLISIEDLMDISTKRNDLMIQQMNTHKDDFTMEDWISSYALLISPKVLKSKPDYIEGILIPKLDESIGQCSLSLSLHNTKNSIVITGLTADFDLLFREDKLGDKAILKKIKLPNKSQIAFHNKKFLNGIEEPLNDYIYKRLVKNKTSHIEQLDIPVFSSYSNKLNYKLMDALEDFTRSSFNTIPFYKNNITLKDYIDQNSYELKRYDLGPSDVLTSILNKNGL